MCQSLPDNHRLRAFAMRKYIGVIHQISGKLFFNPYTKWVMTRIWERLSFVNEVSLGEGVELSRRQAP